MRRSTKASITHLLLAGIFLLPLGACDLTKNYNKMDRSSNLQFQDYRDALSPRPIPQQQAAGAGADGIPAMEPYVSDVPTSMQDMPLVSVAVNQSVPVRDVLFELAKQADFDVELDPRITGSVIFTARNRPFDQVIDRISEMAGLRYTIDNNVLRVELDTPYNVNYKVDYLTAVRTNSSGIQTSVSVVSGEGADTGSSFEISSSSENNFWSDLEAGVGAIISNNSSNNQLRTSQDPSLTVADALPVDLGGASGSARDEPPPAPGADGADAAAGGATADDQGTATTTTTTADGETTTTTEDAGAADAGAGAASDSGAPAPVVQVGSVPQGDDTAGGGASDTGSTEGGGASASFSINRTAGLVTVYASSRLHKEVEEYLHQLRRQMSAQVLIEAKVLEVGLNDEFSTGIRWGEVDLVGSHLNGGFGAIGDDGFSIGTSGAAPTLNAGSASNILSLGYFSGNIDVALQAISRFGTVHALASPRLTVLNNQPAVLNVARNQVYFEIDITTTTEDGVTSTDPDSTIQSVPIGVLINVVPVIDLDKNTITMQIRPTVTRVEDSVLDPAVAFLTDDADLQNRIPIVGVQEIDSVVKMGSGQTLVMGGLLQDRVDSEREGIPVLGELPGIGGAFRNQVDQVEKSELVIFLKATILNDGGLTQTDKDLYKVFAQDRRPLSM